MWRRRASVRLGTEQDLARAGHVLHCASPLAADQRCVTGLLDGPLQVRVLHSFRARVHPCVRLVFAPGQTDPSLVFTSFDKMNASLGDW